MAVSSMDDFWVTKKAKRIPLNDLKQVIERMNAFEFKVRKITSRDSQERVNKMLGKPLPQKSLELLSEETP